MEAHTIEAANHRNLFINLFKEDLLKAIQERNVSKVKKKLKDLERANISYDSTSGCVIGVPSTTHGIMCLHEAIIKVRTDLEFESCTSKSLEIVKTLVVNGADVNEKDEFGQTPLLLAKEGLLLSENPSLFRVHEKLISFLMDHGACIDVVTNDGRTFDSKRIEIVSSDSDTVSDVDSVDAVRVKLVIGPDFFFGWTKTPRILESTISNDKSSLGRVLQIEKDASSEMFPTKLTALHIASWFGNVEMVKILLNFGANPCAEDHFGLSPLMIAAAMGDGPCLSAMLERVDISYMDQKIIAERMVNIKRPSPRVDYQINMPLPVCQGTTILHEAVKSNNPECVAILLRKGARIGIEDAYGNVPLVLAGAGLKTYRTCLRSDLTKNEKSVQNSLNHNIPLIEENGFTEYTKYLNYQKIVSMLLDTDDKSIYSKAVLTNAIINAVVLKSVAVVKLLLDFGADPSYKDVQGTTAFHEAATVGSIEILKHFLNKYKKSESKEENSHRTTMVNVTDCTLSTPLHKAAYWGHHKCVDFLIGSGADLSLKNSQNLSGIEVILLHLDRSKSFIISLMDSCVTLKPAPRWEGDYFLELNFAWISNKDDVHQTAVMKALLDSTMIPSDIKKDILEHPLIESFCRMKWHRTRNYFFAVVTVHVIFVASLSVFVALYYMNHLNDSTTNIWAQIFRVVHFAFALLVLLHVVATTPIEFKFVCLKKVKFETFVLGTSATLSIVWAQAGLVDTPGFFTSPASPNWAKVMLIFMLPLSWAALMLMIGRYRDWGSRALLFGVVLRNVVLTFCVLGLIIVGFSFSLFVLFNSSMPEQFGNPWRSFISTLIMMIGEYNYSDISVGVGVSTRVLFLIFVVVASLVVNNLVVALAVTDAQSLSTVGEWLCLKKKVEFSYILERLATPLASRCILPHRLKYVVNGSQEIGYRLKNRILPRRIVNSLMDLAMKNHPKRKDAQSVEEEGEVIIRFSNGSNGPVELRLSSENSVRVENFLQKLLASADNTSQSALSRSGRHTNHSGEKVRISI